MASLPAQMVLTVSGRLGSSPEARRRQGRHSDGSLPGRSTRHEQHPLRQKRAEWSHARQAWGGRHTSREGAERGVHVACAERLERGGGATVQVGAAETAESAESAGSVAAQGEAEGPREGSLEGAAELAAGSVSVAGEVTPAAVKEAAAGQLVDGANAGTTVAFWVAAAVLFGLGVGVAEGSGPASEFFAGYLLEQSLSVDNLFVFVLIFSYFKVPTEYQARVLTYGVAGAVVCRAIMIGLGIAALQAFEGVNLFFAAVLLFSSYKLLFGANDEDEDLSQNAAVQLCQRLIPVTNYYDGSRFFTVADGMKKATPLLLTLVIVELTDVFFAFDSIPAIFGVTRDPFIVFTSNIFAILGLRSLFTLISSTMADLRFLQPAIALILGFIGTKLVADYSGYHVPTETSLGVVASLLGGGVFLSLRFPKSDQEDSL